MVGLVVEHVHHQYAGGENAVLLFLALVFNESRVLLKTGLILFRPADSE
jgi:hypothetical protein